MSTLIEIVDSLESRVDNLLEKLNELQQSNLRLKEELAAAEQQRLQIERTLKAQQEENETLKMTSAMLGSNQYKRETKLKINALIREIDLCITQLAD